MKTNGSQTALGIESTYYQDAARRIREYVVRRGWADEAQRATRHHPLPIRMFMTDRREQFEAWAYESLYTALASDDAVIAFRAYGQAIEYLTRLRYEYHLPVGGLGDYLSTAKNRLEDHFRGRE
jgi:hypothetical protein